MSERVAAQIAIDENQDTIVGSTVRLASATSEVYGTIVGDSYSDFGVEWYDGTNSIESKSDYELVIKTATSLSDNLEKEKKRRSGETSFFQIMLFH